MEKTTRNFLILIIFVAGLISCSDVTAPDSVEMPELPRSISKSEQTLIESSNAFGFDLFKILSNKANGNNLFVSPVSVSMALGMTANGAAGSTLEAMHSTLGFENLTEDEINQSYQSLINLLRSLDSKVKFRIANSIWYRNEFTALPTFIDVNQTYFDAVVRGLDFNQDAAVDTMNAWIEAQTDGFIKQLIEKPINTNTIMFLLNAIYFKGTWTYQFNEEHTQEAPFYLNNDNTANCQMMSLSSDFDYAETDELQIIDLPYNNGFFTMTVLLPQSSDDLNSLISGMTDEKWNNLIAGLSTTTVSLYLPKFKLEWFQVLNDQLSELGMGIAFDNRADFSRINDQYGSELYISEVRHKSFIEVDEEGTEAAAAASVEITYKSVSDDTEDITVMRVDHPFIFAIRERASGTILFIGKIINPVS
ncbi:MAG TPA: serpin family protein [Candidatus Marinimicrobia bacterium]|nr:serpin family protein [Candidatus Neomarinimicrobiota bacterium]HQE95085.1 serpin family protein [Candidatus Neomarinimicrobiota bacterium]HQH54983.1 serpin family protein [Candidatus Neomarinimicrobiota bacterium]HQK10603.1 serpin family protein [Candidatus Neomarinimicrobiota bacterium]